MANVVFVAPHLLPGTLRFARALAGLPDVRLALVSREPLDRVPAELRSALSGHWRLDAVDDPGALAEAVRGVAGQIGPPDRLLGVLEQLQEPLGEVRDRLGIPGMGAEAARNFRDKARMKTLLRAAGLPCARHGLAASAEEARVFLGEVGYPVVVKPPAGAGARSTFRLDGAAQLEEALRAHGPTAGAPWMIEEMVEGEEHSFDTVSIAGRPVWHSLTRYLPTPLEVLRNPWIQWCVLLPREVDEPRYDDVRRHAFRALEVLGMGTGVSHLEWFRRPDGAVALSEVAARPPGAQITTLIGVAHDIDFLAAWARLVVFDRFDPPPRRYAAGAAFLRGQGRGTVRAVHGLEQAQKEVGDLVVEVRLPRAGQPKAEGYEGEGYVIVRHESTEVVERALSRIVSTIRVEVA